jgi:hypothetical protein
MNRDEMLVLLVQSLAVGLQTRVCKMMIKICALWIDWKIYPVYLTLAHDST